MLSPTRIIRDQWIRRLTDFGVEGEPFDLHWISTDLSRPALLTSATYQAVHVKAVRQGAQVPPDDEPEPPETDDQSSIPDAKALLAVIAQGGIEVVVLDEAHHLTAEWWKALKAVVTSVPEIVLVSLTATTGQVESVWLAFGRPGVIRQYPLRLFSHEGLWWDQGSPDQDAKLPNRLVVDAVYSRTMYWHNPPDTSPHCRPLQEESHPNDFQNVQSPHGNLTECYRSDVVIYICHAYFLVPLGERSFLVPLGERSGFGSNSPNIPHWSTDLALPHLSRSCLRSP